MFNYCKRNKYILRKSRVGRNNKGHITIRGRQNKQLNLNQFKNVNYTYISLENIKNYIKNNIIKFRIIKEITDYNLQRNMFKIIFLNSSLKNQYKYISKTIKLKIGDISYIGEKYSILKEGSIVCVKILTCGSWIHNIESIKLKGSTFVRSSKISALLLSSGLKYVVIKLPSGVIRLIKNNVFCIYGQIDTSPIYINKLEKAGTSRKFGKRPKVRGVAMNACDHSHGGGEGKNSIGRPSICSPWGNIFKGMKTRKKKKYSNKLILKN